jgi:ribose transport system ATP-binding protein
MTGGGDLGRLPPALTVEALSKSFAGTPALQSVDLTVERGQIHALLGENGSGKSTLIKVLAGYHSPDPGSTVAVDGAQLEFGNPASSYALGCRFVHQDLALVGTSSILDNLSLNGGFDARWGTIRPNRSVARARHDLAAVGLDLDPRILVDDLPPAMKTGVAVARALRTFDGASAVKLLVLDEPTATLPRDEVDQLSAIVKTVAAGGVGVLYVTHRLDEVFDLAGLVTILRDGRKVASQEVASLDHGRLIALLVGAELDKAGPASTTGRVDHGDPAIEVEALEADNLKGVSFKAHPGSIVGLAGIAGSGSETLLAAVFGAIPRDSGQVRVAGRRLSPLRPDLAMEAGIAYLPADRRIRGGMMDMTALENLTLTRLRPFWRWPFLRGGLEAAETRKWFERLSVRPATRVDQRLAAFSGGNQQKILFGKWLRLNPTVILMDEPTQGVDVGAKAELHSQLRDAASGGAAIIVSSSDFEELADLCSEVIVLRDGQVAGRLRGEGLTPAGISRASLGSAHLHDRLDERVAP